MNAEDPEVKNLEKKVTAEFDFRELINRTRKMRVLDTFQQQKESFTRILQPLLMSIQNIEQLDEDEKDAALNQCKTGITLVLKKLGECKDVVISTKQGDNVMSEPAYNALKELEEDVLQRSAERGNTPKNTPKHSSSDSVFMLNRGIEINPLKILPRAETPALTSPQQSPTCQKSEPIEEPPKEEIRIVPVGGTGWVKPPSVKSTIKQLNGVVGSVSDFPSLDAAAKMPKIKPGKVAETKKFEFQTRLENIFHEDYSWLVPALLAREQ